VEWPDFQGNNCVVQSAQRIAASRLKCMHDVRVKTCRQNHDSMEHGKSVFATAVCRAIDARAWLSKHEGTYLCGRLHNVLRIEALDYMGVQNNIDTMRGLTCQPSSMNLFRLAAWC
jgi:hypothetical protein